MTYDETLVLMGIMKTAYPDYYKAMRRTEADKTVALWAELLEPFPFEICAFAVKRLIAESPYPPKISDVMQRVKETIQAGEDTAGDAWNALQKAASRASVVTAEEFKALPPEVQRFCGSLSGLLELGMLDSGTFNTVTRGQFLKTYEGMKRSRETVEAMPESVRALVASLVKPVVAPSKRQLAEPAAEATPLTIDEPEPYTTPSEEEWERLRQEQLRRLMC